MTKDEWEQGFAARFAPAEQPAGGAHGDRAGIGLCRACAGNGAVMSGRGLY